MTLRRLLKSPFRSSFRYRTRMQYGLPRPPGTNDLRLACRYIAQLIRWHKRMIKEDPELFDPRCRQAREEAEAREARLREYEAVIKKIYSEPVS